MSLNRLTASELEELTAQVRHHLAMEEEVEDAVRRLEVKVAGIRETQEKLSAVVKAFLPDTDDSKVVLTTLQDWLFTARQHMVGEALVERHSWRKYTSDEVDDLVFGDEIGELVWNRVDVDALREPWPEETVDTLDVVDEPESNRFPTMTHGLLIGVMALLLCILIVMVR